MRSLFLIFEHSDEEEESNGVYTTNRTNKPGLDRRSSTQTLGQPFSITLTRNGLHMGKLSGKIVVRRVAICEQVIQKLKKFENTVMNERTFQIEIIKKEGRHDLHRMSSLITDPQQQPSKIILEQLTSDLQVRIEGSEKIVNVTTGKSFTKYRISVMVSILSEGERASRIWSTVVVVIVIFMT